jgi:hypothetical protein
VSDVAAALWTSTWERHGFQAFAEPAAPQLIRWESRHGWTRYGEGPVAATETSLVVVLARMLRVPDTWEGFAEQYVRALDRLCDLGASTRRIRGFGDTAQQRAGALAEWQGLLLRTWWTPRAVCSTCGSSVLMCRGLVMLRLAPLRSRERVTPPCTQQKPHSTTPPNMRVHSPRLAFQCATRPTCCTCHHSASANLLQRVKPAPPVSSARSRSCAAAHRGMHVRGRSPVSGNSNFTVSRPIPGDRRRVRALRS